MQFIIRKPGLSATIQDLGRKYYPAQAVPLAGAMDTLSARMANKAAGNNDGDALIEFTYGGAMLTAEEDALIAYSGGGCRLYANDQFIPADRPVYLPSGTTLILKNSSSGCRAYLAVAGGWSVPEVLQSRSTYLPASLGGMEGRMLKENDRLKNTGILNELSTAILKQLNNGSVCYPSWSIAGSLLLPEERKTIRVIPAREHEWFTTESREAFFSSTWQLSNKSNRIGYYLEGPVIKRQTQQELLSTSVTPGTIQVTGNGNPVMLMADCQTTGGYPRMAQVAAADLPLCGQLRPGDKISFKKISLHEAERLYFEQENQLKEISDAICLKYL